MEPLRNSDSIVHSMLLEQFELHRLIELDEHCKLLCLTDPLYPTVWVLEDGVCKIIRNQGNFRVTRVKCFFCYSPSPN